jgi:hypothetical protein
VSGGGSEAVGAATPRRAGWRLLVGAALLLPALWHAGAIARIFLSRAAYPMDIEWLEGGELYQAYRWDHGLSLYGPPDQGYLPYTHPPLHFVALSLAGRVAGLDYATGRALSAFFFALACAAVAAAVWRACTSPAERLTAPAFAVAMAMASFPVAGGIYDLIRNDTLALGLVLLAAVLVGDGRTSTTRIVLAAAVLTAEGFTRLPYLAMGVALGVFVLARSRRNGLLLGGCTALAGGAALGGLQLATGGWFWWYSVTVLSGHPLVAKRFLDGLRAVLDFAPFLVALPFVLGMPAFRRRLSPRTVLWCALLGAALPAGLLPYAKLGGFDNDLIPIVFLAGPVAVLVVLDLLRGAPGAPGPPGWVRWSAVVAASAFLAWRTYDPARFIPDASRWARAERLNSFVAGLRGGVIIPNHPFLPIRNGQTGPQLHTMPYLDVIGRGLGEAIYPYIETSNAAWAILDGGEPLVRETVLSLYDFVGTLPDPVSTMVGFPSSPSLLFKRREPLRKSAVRVLFDFESASYEGWTATGDAFGSSPTAGRPPDQGVILGYRGRGLANSFSRASGDAATGTLTSPLFTIDRRSLALLVGGGTRAATRVELRVDGRPVREASGPGGDVMVGTVWDVSTFRGRQGQIAIVDEDTGPWGHVLADQIELFDPPGAP